MSHVWGGARPAVKSRLTSVSKNATKARRAVLTPQLGCQLSGWKDEMLKQILVLVSNLPEGVATYTSGGANGYDGGSASRPW